MSRIHPDEKELFYAALSVPQGTARSEYLSSACGHDFTLRTRVESLLAAAESESTFLRSSAPESWEEADADASCGCSGDKLPATSDPSHGGDAAARSGHCDELIGQLIGRYEVISLLGAGGMGRVYLAYDPQLDRQIALKLIAADQDNPASDRLLHEARLAAGLDHPNICPVYDVGDCSGRRYIAMQHLEGRTLKQFVDGRPLPLKILLPLALQIADALSAAHRQGIVHRDVKPGNILVMSTGKVKVLDFGLARVVGTTERTAQVPDGIVGTPAFMSPEQARGLAVDARGDIFSLGTVLWFMATGKAPFQGESPAGLLRAVLSERSGATELGADCPLLLAEIIERAMAKEPSARYQTIDEMSADLSNLCAKPEDVGNPVPQRVRPWWIAVAVVGLTVAGLTADWAWRRRNVNWAVRQVPVVEARSREGRTFEAYDLWTRIRDDVPHHAKLAQLTPALANLLSVYSDPPGAQVYLVRYDDAARAGRSQPRFIGTTPCEHVEIPRGDHLLRVEKEGFRTHERTLSGAFISGLEKLSPPLVIHAKLIRPDNRTEGMVYVPPSEPDSSYRLVGWRRPTLAKVPVPGFYIDRYEVTNQQFKEFVDAGGYQTKAYWNLPSEGERAGAQMLSQMKDRTDKHAPRGWSHANFPPGSANHPVTGVTWYEAAAYAAFRGKSLPTIYQWEKAARDGQSNPFGLVMPWGLLQGPVEGRANFTRVARPVGSFPFGLSPFGCHDMAGNVAEWCANNTSAGFLVGGASWRDMPYQFGYYATAEGLSTTDARGFRCVLNLSPLEDQAERIDLEREVPSYQPKSKAEVRAWLTDFDYAPGDSVVASSPQAGADWSRQELRYRGANSERKAVLYLPKQGLWPCPVIHFVPAADVWYGLRTLSQSIEADYAGYLRNGYAIFAVEMRPPASPAKWPLLHTSDYAEAVAAEVRDVRLGLDYLRTRPELDNQKLVFLQSSAGGYPLILAAVEARYRAVVFVGGGIKRGDPSRNERANPINFVPLIACPKLMIHGEFDETTPWESEGRPLFDLLAANRHVRRFSGSHIPSPSEQLQMVGDWLKEQFPKTP